MDTVEGGLIPPSHRLHGEANPLSNGSPAAITRTRGRSGGNTLRNSKARSPERPLRNGTMRLRWNSRDT